MNKPKRPKGFSASRYDKQSTKAGKKIQRTTKLVTAPAIQDYDQRASSVLNQRRVSTVKPKPMAMTYGSSKAGKGATKYKRKAK